MPSPVSIKIGDQEWMNYSYSIDVKPIDVFHFITMNVRDQGFKKLRYQGNKYGGKWSYLDDDNKFVSLVDSDISWNEGVDVVVEDDFVYHTDSQGLVKVIANTYSPKGRLILEFDGVAIDNLTITRND